MGYLHEGHLRAGGRGARRADVVLLSIFVNPLQFGPTEDLARYPRDLAARPPRSPRRAGWTRSSCRARRRCIRRARRSAWCPGASAERWEGAARPGHFAGVLTVVAKLFHLVEPDVACFGRKDVQQAVLIRQMVRDLDWPIELAVVPTVREPDGLALSSRNAYLDPEQRRRATALSGALAGGARGVARR